MSNKSHFWNKQTKFDDVADEVRQLQVSKRVYYVFITLLKT